jgi:4-azaleucine resistance transporter AzlC
MQFVLVTLLGGGAGLLYTAMMTLFVNGRHIFYGLSLVEKYQNMGKSYPYMIFSLTDETYSLECQLKVPQHLNEKRVMLLVSLLDHSYWVAGSLLGGLVGRFIIFDSTGIEFSMTALFTAIVVEKWREKSNRLPVLIGSGCSLLFLLLLGADRFILPALALSVAVLLLYRKEKND